MVTTKILNGRENEATLYFKDRTEQKLTELFQPVVHKTMAEVGVTRNTEKKQPVKEPPATSKPAMALPIKALFLDEFAVKNGFVNYTYSAQPPVSG